MEPIRLNAKYSLATERAMLRINNFDYIIVRPAIVYGTYDLSSYMTLNIMASAMYKFMKEKMLVLWEKEKKVNMVHVRDVIRAIFYILEKGKACEVYNLSAPENLDQNTFYEFLRQIYQV